MSFYQFWRVTLIYFYQKRYQAILLGVLLTISFVSFFFPSPNNYLSHSFFHPLLSLRKDIACFDGYSWLVWISIGLNYLLVFLLGRSLLYHFFSDKNKHPLFLELWASFPFGFLGIVSLTRIVSFAVSFQSTYWIVCSISIFIILKFFIFSEISFLYNNHGLRSFVRGWLKEKGGPFFFGSLLSLGFVWLALLLQVRQGDFTWIGHGPSQYPVFLQDWRAEPFAHFPIITQHYAEMIFHYFILGNIKASLDPTVSFWITLALMKLGVFVFIFLCMKRLNFSRVFCFLSVFFLYFGTSSLDPYRYYLIFDSSNPLFFCVHSDRVIGISLILFLFSELSRYRDKQWSTPFWVIFLIGLGVSATSISNSLWVTVIGFLMTFIFCYFSLNYPQLSQGRSVQDGEIILSIDRFFCFSAIGVCVLLYALPFQIFLYHIFRLILVLIIIALMTKRALKQIFNIWNRLQEQFRSFYRIFSFFISLLITIVIGHVFLGNIAVENFLSFRFAQVLSRWVGELSYLSISSPISHGLLREGSLAIGDFRELGRWNEYCQNAVFFITIYGLIFVFVLLTNYFFVKAKERGEPFLFLDGFIYEVFLFCSGSLPAVFFIIDFWDIGPRTWLLSRFLEIPVYFIVFAFLYSMQRFLGSIQKMVLSLLLVVYMVIPFCSAERPRQMIENYRFFKVVIKNCRLNEHRL